ncbi:hypothetical protein PHAVU_008G088300 [Phaseolus vulgaris]|uniref:Uncharacterized protein n=1 Tax=Phaseolus vulgaris TaxID=3885 RepID=V7B2P6_PHAVU|nr:hypothetical protein PHAVU_008G088300g [Phaseolus vulgaris]ESW12147.1 hypothetical protein PHAVU_008G088300g [Phaseolus vulgaris]
MAKQVSVINSSYCAPHSISLQINTEKGATYNEKDDRLFYTDDTFFTLHNRRVLHDDAENPIVTLYNKMENNGGFNVFVNPNIHYAFIVTLLTIMIVKT